MRSTCNTTIVEYYNATRIRAEFFFALSIRSLTCVGFEAGIFSYLLRVFINLLVKMNVTSNPNNPNALKLIVAAEISGKKFAIDFTSDQKRESPNLF
jgi:hypothetical protein